MRNYKDFAARLAVAAGVVTLVSASAFADSRHSQETRSHDRSRSATRGESRRSDISSNDRWNRDNRSNERRSAPRQYGGSYRSDSFRRGDNSYRGDSRSYRGDSHSYRGNSYGSRQPYYAHGRVTRILPYGGGFRIWIGGAPYPFFIPEAYYYRHRLRIGLSIGLGGYYNPGGYYDYYDGGGYSAGDLRGVVESVDYRRNTFVVRNDASGSFVTVAMRDGRREVRAGDYVELVGDWTRSGYFEAYDIRLLDDNYRR